MNDRAAISQVVCNADGQGSRQLPCTLAVVSEGPARRTIESCERELSHYRSMETRLRDALAENEERLRQKDEMIPRQELLKTKFNHRLLNDLQMAIGLPSLQSRGSTNAEAAEQLAVAANRFAMIARIHHPLNSYEGMQIIEFNNLIAEFSGDFSAMVSSAESPEQFTVESVEINLPAATSIPFSFIASELITNAAKYGKSRIAIKLEQNPEYGYALSVSNDGQALPEGFDPGAIYRVVSLHAWQSREQIVKGNALTGGSD